MYKGEFGDSLGQVRIIRTNKYLRNRYGLKIGVFAEAISTKENADGVDGERRDGMVIVKPPKGNNVIGLYHHEFEKIGWR